MLALVGDVPRVVNRVEVGLALEDGGLCSLQLHLIEELPCELKVVLLLTRALLCLYGAAEVVLLLRKHGTHLRVQSLPQGSQSSITLERGLLREQRLRRY